jgi:hypothetical protein
MRWLEYTSREGIAAARAKVRKVTSLKRRSPAITLVGPEGFEPPTKGL